MTACSFTFTGLTHKGLTFNFILLILKYYHVNVEKHKKDSTKTKARETLEVYFALQENWLKVNFCFQF